MTLSYPFASSLDTSQNITFVDVTPLQPSYGVPVTLEGTPEQGLFMLYAHNQNPGMRSPGGDRTFFLINCLESGGIVVVETTSNCIGVTMVPDDWSWPWASATPDAKFSLFSSNAPGHGWVLLGQTLSNCTITISSADANTIQLGSNVSLFLIGYCEQITLSMTSLIYHPVPCSLCSLN